MAVVRKLKHVLQNGGAIELLRFIGSRLLRTQAHLVFSCNPDSAYAAPTWRPDEIVLEANNAAEIEALEAHCDLPTALAEYLDSVRNGSAVGVFILADGALVHWAFLMKRTRTLCYLGFDCAHSALLGSAATIPAARGRGLQTRSVIQRIQIAARQGIHTVVSETAPDNAFSERALQSGGMQKLGHLRLWIICNRVVIRFGRVPKPAFSISYCR